MPGHRRHRRPHPRSQGPLPPQAANLEAKACRVPGLASGTLGAHLAPEPDARARPAANSPAGPQGRPDPALLQGVCRQRQDGRRGHGDDAHRRTLCRRLHADTPPRRRHGHPAPRAAPKDEHRDVVKDLQPYHLGHRHNLAAGEEGEAGAADVHAQAQARHGQRGASGQELEEGEVCAEAQGKGQGEPGRIQAADTGSQKQTVVSYMWVGGGRGGVFVPCALGTESHLS